MKRKKLKGDYKGFSDVTNEKRKEMQDKLRHTPEHPNGQVRFDFKHRELLTPVEGVDYGNVPAHPTNYGRDKLKNTRTYKMLVEKTREGNYISTVGKLAGVSHGQINTWLKWGREGKDELYVKFWQDMCKAEAEAESNMLASVLKHGDRDWRATMEVLSRRYHDNWGKRSETHLRVEGQVDHKVETRNEFAEKILADPRARELARRLLEAAPVTIDGESGEVSDT